MLQVVRRPSPFVLNAAAAEKLQAEVRKLRILAFAFVSLAAVNLFVIASAASLYYLVHRS